ncbi:MULTISPECIES: cell division protein FtsQ/DivIB [unclassified Nesterenkonia]|uniref:cell division protein FtsQ/DivIB n=1 Tax=unclassified Nesterenkonia TaxID=2629769 RepID=UPI001F4D0CD1|nr:MULTISPECIES: cell division protein FtsQ/DivIB [unclassified Nesterenkonia]MCH8559525.1 cell division protein FtsQ/DivIB [Nesterenkonia sp. DZ6]MCH8570399.1 cell division protein FtsQ/DivIB [Nesterenkonia sp. AY15]
MRLRFPRRAPDHDKPSDADHDEFSDTDDDEFGDASPLDFPEPAAVIGRRRRRRRILALLISLAVLLGVVATLYFSPLLVVRAIAVQDNDLLTDQRAQELLAPLHGTPLAQVSQRDVERLLQDERAVDEVIVAARLPEGLDIVVIEHPPVAEVHVGEEILFYSQEGELIRTFDESQAEDAQGYATPVISAEAALENEAVFQTIVSVLGQLPEGARESLESATAESRDSVQLELQDGRTVVWGDDQRGDEKATVLEAILGSSAGEFEGVEVLDISTPSAPVTR